MVYGNARPLWIDDLCLPSLIFFPLHKSNDITIKLMSLFTKIRLLFLCRWSAYVEDGKIKALNVEEAPSDMKVSGADVILGQI